MPLREARDVMDKRGKLDEINVVVSGGDSEIEAVQKRLRQRLPGGVEVDTPQAKGDEVESQLQAFNAILYFFAAMALFVGGFLIFNAFNMSVFQRTREIGMLRTLGASRGRIAGSVLTEALVLGLIGSVVGLGARGRAGAAPDRADARARLPRRRPGSDARSLRSPRSPPGW